jgi:hypothetical protein
MTKRRQLQELLFVALKGENIVELPIGYAEHQRHQKPLKQESERDLDLNQSLSTPSFSNMIRDVFGLGLLKVG